MFFHVFKYRLRCIVKDKQMMFWTLLFPIALGTFFNMAFENLNSAVTFDTIPIAYVEESDAEADDQVGQTLAHLSDEKEEQPLFKLYETDVSEAASMLEKGEITAYIVSGDRPKIYVRGSGLYQTIVKMVIDSVIRTDSMVQKIVMADPLAFEKGLAERLSDTRSFISRDEDIGRNSPDNTLIYFYSLMAMTCFYGAFVGIKEVYALQADLSAEGIRVNLSPQKKSSLSLSSISAAVVIQFTVILILLAYLIFVLRISFGDQLGYILLLCFSGCIAGVCFGTMIGTLIKGGEGIKTALLIGITMSFSFLSGMMQVSVKYAVTKAVPILAYINPLNLITDGFYSLYYYPDHKRFFINILCLWGFILIFSVLTIMKLRRTRYASV